jgi:hypothetical protein
VNAAIAAAAVAVTARIQRQQGKKAEHPLMSDVFIS